MKASRLLFLLSLCAPLATAFAATSEITVDLKLDSLDYVVGERVRGVVRVVNVSPDTIEVGKSGAKDRFFVEVFRAKDKSQLESLSDRTFVAPFMLKPNEGQKLELFLGDHYGLSTPARYLARPVLVHGGIRYEGQARAFDIVPGMLIGSALQMFSNHEGLRREFNLLTWSRDRQEHLFLCARDTGTSNRIWITTDLGPLMKITKPTVSVMPDGRILILHRVDSDYFISSEFWSVRDGIEFRSRRLLHDPETAGSARVRELYKEAGGVKPADRPWWKFW